ncbi:MAG: phenylacetate--CoA ligase family protein [Dorea sp.]|nr:phenylacetate--CoA ligase family protein [Dorea sp.]
MAFVIEKKLKNVMTFYYLMKLDKKIPTDRAFIRKRQGKKVHELMERAYKIPFYRKRFDENHLTPDDFHTPEDLVKFPITTRADLRLWMQEEYEKNPKKRKSWTILSTSGSSGVPLKFIQTQRESACVDANWIRVLMYAGYHPLRGKLFSFVTSHKKIDPKKGDSIIQKFGFMRRKVVSEDNCVGDGIRDIIKDLNEYKPDVLCFRRNCLVRMALYAKRHNLKIYKPKLYTPVSEMVDDMTRKILTESFGDGLFDAYGSSETGSCIIQLPGEELYYINSDTHVVNIYDEDNRLTDDGRVIVTTLFKKDFPFINYEIGDRATSATLDGVRYIKSIQGRVNDLVKHENSPETSALYLMKIPNGIVGIAQFKFIQESYHDMRILLVKDPNNNAHTKEEIESFFRKKMAELFNDEFTLHFDWLEVIPPDKNGKMRCFACEIPDEAH